MRLLHQKAEFYARLHPYLMRVIFLLLSLGFIFLINVSSAEAAGKRIALVIGNNDYPYQGFLDRSASDAESVHSILEKLHFEVIYRVNSNKEEMAAEFRLFLNELSPDDVAVFYFAGHGAQFRGVDVLFPTDSRQPDDGFVVAQTLAAIAQRRPRFVLAIIDACRTDPDVPQEPRVRSIPPTDRFGREVRTGNLSPENPPPGMMIVYSAASGQSAQDDLGNGDDTEPHGLFAHELLKYLSLPLSVKQMMRQVQTAVVSRSGNKQTPAIYDNAQRDFYLLQPGAPSASVVPEPPAGQQLPPPASPMPDRSPPAGSQLFSSRPVDDIWDALNQGDCDRAAGGIGELIKFLPPRAENDTVEQRALRYVVLRMFKDSGRCSARLRSPNNPYAAENSPPTILDETWDAVRRGDCESIRFKIRAMEKLLPARIQDMTVVQKALQDEIVRITARNMSCQTIKNDDDYTKDGLKEKHATLPEPTGSGPFDGEYYNSQYRFGFRIKGGFGMATVSNSPAYPPGERILTFGPNGARAFVGMMQFCADGNFHYVDGLLLDNGSIALTIKGCGASNTSLTMVRTR
jgi:hypothetical protein